MLTFRSVWLVLAGAALVSGCGGESEDGPTPAAALFAASADCFVLEGTTLTMYVTETESDELTKVAD